MEERERGSMEGDKTPAGRPRDSHEGDQSKIPQRQRQSRRRGRPEEMAREHTSRRLCQRAGENPSRGPTRRSQPGARRLRGDSEAHRVHSSVVPQEAATRNYWQSSETQETAGDPRPRRSHHRWTAAGRLGVHAMQETGPQQNWPEGPPKLDLQRRTWWQGRERSNSRDTPDGGHQGRLLV